MAEQALGDLEVDFSSIDVASRDVVLATAKVFEELGVAAHKGQAGNLIANDGILTAALQIHSVQAACGHRAADRRLEKLGRGL